MHLSFPASVLISLASTASIMASNNFRSRCANIVVFSPSPNIYFLEATCTTTSGTSVVSSINLNQCVGFQINKGLICEENGGFTASCSNCQGGVGGNCCAGDQFGDFDCVCGQGLFGSSGVNLDDCVGVFLASGQLECNV